MGSRAVRKLSSSPWVQLRSIRTGVRREAAAGEEGAVKQMLCAKSGLTMGIQAGTVAQLVECLPSMQEALGHLVSNITWEQSSFQEVAAEGSEVQGHPRLHTEFKTSLGNVRPHFKR